MIVTRLCDSVVLPPSIYNINNDDTSAIVSDLSSGLEYTVSIVPYNILGKGMEAVDTVTVQENG